MVLIQTGRDVARVAEEVGPLALAKVNGRQFEAAYYLTLELRSRGPKVHGRDTQQESAHTTGRVHTFIERTDRVLQVIESIVPAVRWLSEEAAMTYTRTRMAQERTGVRCASEIVLNLWIVFSACALLRLSAGGMV
jgi:hypothetical protein